MACTEQVMYSSATALANKHFEAPVCQCLYTPVMQHVPASQAGAAEAGSACPQLLQEGGGAACWSNWQQQAHLELPNVIELCCTMYALGN
jgi:hypothetical protein